MKPLYEQIRPKSLDKIVGQDHLVGENGKIRLIIQSKLPVSMLLYGPPGSGKTTIARLYAEAFSMPFHMFTGSLQSTAEIKKLLAEEAKSPLFKRSMVIFFDEIHRISKAQQDLFLPFLEDGSLILVCATTENPSFSLNGALLSRLHSLKLNSLDISALMELIQQCEATLGPLGISSNAKETICRLSAGDGRFLINLIDGISRLPAEEKADKKIGAHLMKRPALYDKAADSHYNLISALHKSIRGSDPNAALYWLARMLNGGEDPLFITRRLVRAASEDIGLADPQALPLTLAAHQTYEMLGSPEGELAIAQAVIYLALAPKSNACYKALGKVRKAAEDTSHLSPPKEILNAPNAWMQAEGNGQGYMYDHDLPQGFSGQSYFPPEMGNGASKNYYDPLERGFEREMIKRIQYFHLLRNKNL